MSLRRRIARNVAWNWAGTATHMAAGFIVFPVLIQRLGVTDCGLWLLIISLTGYFDVLDLGLRESVGRHIAFHRAEGGAAVGRVFNTGLMLLAGGAVLVLLATAGVQLVFFQLFDVEPAAQADARLAVWLIGLNLALIFPFNTFEGVLWGHERFDLINRVDIPCVVARATLTILLVGSGPQNLVTLALILLGVTLARGAGLGYCATRVQPGLRLSWRLFSLKTVWELFDFGIWCCLMSIAGVLSLQLGPTLIGNRFGTAMVTTFSAAQRLVNYARTVLVTTTGVLTPLATAWHAAAEDDKQRGLFLHGGKFCLALGLFFVGGFWFLGEPFLRLWTGRELESAWLMLMVLILGELLPMSQRITFSTLLGMNRHRLWAMMSMLEVLLIVVLATIFLAFDSSILSIALALAIPAAVCRGVVQIVSGCRLLRVPVTQYVWRALLPPLVCAAGPILLLGLLVEARPVDRWAWLLGCGMLYTLAYALAVTVVLVRPDRVRRLWSALQQQSPLSRPAVGGDAVPPMNPEPSGAPVLR